MSLVDTLKELKESHKNIGWPGQDISFLFVGASRLDRAKASDKLRAKFTAYTGVEWEKREEIIQGRLEQQVVYDGVKHFKRRALGFCGRSTTKTPDQMAQLLCASGVASSLEEAKEILPFLGGTHAQYEINLPEVMVSWRYLLFDQIQDYSGNVSYKVHLQFFISDD